MTLEKFQITYFIKNFKPNIIVINTKKGGLPMKKWVLLIGVIFYLSAFVKVGTAQPDASVMIPAETTKAPAGESSETEKVTYLGVSVVPAGETITAQLRLPRNTGLVIVYVDIEGPSAKILEKNDVLHKLNDQLLINPEQFATLVKMFKPGDEISLSVFRAGAPLTLKVKLGERKIVPGEMPSGFRASSFFRFYTPQKNEEILDKIRKWLDDIGLERDRIRDTADSMWKDIMETLRDWDNAPQPFRFGRKRELDIEKGSTKVISVSPDGASYTDNEHRLVITRTERGLMLSARDKTGKLMFDGPVDNEEQLERVPAEIKRKARELREKLLSQPAPLPGANRETM